MNNDLTFLSFLNSSYLDESIDTNDYLRDAVDFSISTAGDKFYVGLYKPFNSNYIELLSAATASINLSFAYSNGSSFQPLEVRDDTKGLSRSGFIEWDRNIEDWSEQSVNGVSKYWIEVSFDSALFDVSIQGWNIVFSDDLAMSAKDPYVSNYIPRDDNSFIKYHVAARDEIVQRMRNGGYLKQENDAFDSSVFSQGINDRKNITKWDILDRGEIKEAATYKALAKVYFNDSRNVDDKSFLMYRELDGMFGQSFKLFYFSVDFDDDGKADSNERLASNETFVSYE